MDFPLIKKIVESFLDDYDIKNQKVEEVSTEVLEFIRDLRENDIELYHLYQDKPILEQTRILQNYLYSIYFEDELIEKLNNQSQLLEKDLIPELIDEGLLSTIIPGFIFTKTLIVGALAYIITVLMSKKVSRFHFKVISKIGEFIESIGKTLIKSGRRYKFRYQILQQNSLKCYKSCGVDPKDISPLAYWHVYQDSKINVTSEKAIHQSECLRDCYVYYFIELLQLYLEQYFTCLKKTGEFERIKRAKLSDLMSIVFSTNISGSCEEFYKLLRGKMDMFDDLINLVYVNPSDRQNAISKLLKSIDTARNNVSHQK